MKLLNIPQVRKFLKSAENPIFIFDDDADGLCSFILLHNYIEKGKGMVTKGGGLLKDERFAENINNYSPDVLFILDVPVISQDFVDMIKCKRIVWIDHHDPQKIRGIYYHNPRVKQKNIYMPTSELCYEITKGDKWIAGLGIIGDYKIPTFFKDLNKKYKDLFSNRKNIEDLLFDTKFGDLIRIINYNLKGKSAEVKKFIRVFNQIKDPYEILDQKTANAKFIFKRYKKLRDRYDKLLKKALTEGKSSKMFFIFTYINVQDSFTAELAQELKHRFKKKIILVGRQKSGEIRLSIRSTNILPIKDIIIKIMQEVDGRGGGHDYACGAAVKEYDFEKFLKMFKDEVKKKQS